MDLRPWFEEEGGGRDSCWGGGWERVVVDAVSVFDVRVILWTVEGRGEVGSSSESESASQVISSSSAEVVDAAYLLHFGD